MVHGHLPDRCPGKCCSPDGSLRVRLVASRRRVRGRKSFLTLLSGIRHDISTVPQAMRQRLATNARLRPSPFNRSSKLPAMAYAKQINPRSVTTTLSPAGRGWLKVSGSSSPVQEAVTTGGLCGLLLCALLRLPSRATPSRPARAATAPSAPRPPAAATTAAPRTTSPDERAGTPREKERALAGKRKRPGREGLLSAACGHRAHRTRSASRPTSSPSGQTPPGREARSLPAPAAQSGSGLTSAAACAPTGAAPAGGTPPARWGRPSSGPGRCR